MLKTRAAKYKAFLRYLRFFKYISFAPIRGEFLECYYVMMRYLDDIVDGDAPLPEGYASGSQYLMEKIDFSLKRENPKDEVDFLMLHCFDLAQKFGEEFHEETKDILDSLLFDANRRNKFLILSNEDLMYHFHLLDVRGTIKATLKIFKEDPDKYEILQSLGIATRLQYTLEDFESDVKVGYINISKEDCIKFGISKEDILNINSPKIKDWLRSTANQGMQLLDDHRANLHKGKFSLLTRATFPLVYEYPARRVFRQFLK